MEKNIQGPFSYRNWKIALVSNDWKQVVEYPLFSDAHMVNEIVQGMGPYQIINNVATLNGRPAITLRVQQYLQFDLPQMSETQEEYYHGGVESDEIAALLSLCLGVRMKAGEATREFSKEGDPMGRPLGGAFSTDPSLAQILTNKYRKPILKNARGEHFITDAKILATLPYISSTNAIALIRAARLYQEAIWIVETTPELSWIMFASAIETVANQWRTDKTSNVERLKIAKPNLEEILRSYSADKGDEIVQKVADEIAPILGATKTFIDFIVEFLPPAPPRRPPLVAQVNWEKSSMRKLMSQIYAYRSRALHGGHPFPAPMCQPPFELGDNNEPAEVLTALAMSTQGSVWMAKDIPMFLHTFEYICRNVILNWWKSVAQVADS